MDYAEPVIKFGYLFQRYIHANKGKLDFMVYLQNNFKSTLSEKTYYKPKRFPVNIIDPEYSISKYTFAGLSSETNTVPQNEKVTKFYELSFHTLQKILSRLDNSTTTTFNQSKLTNCTYYSPTESSKKRSHRTNVTFYRG